MENTALTQGISNNWLVQVGKKELTLNQKQYDKIVQADQQGNVKMVHFKDFSVNLSYISYMEKIKKAKVEEIPESSISDEQAKLNREMIAKMRLKI